LVKVIKLFNILKDFAMFSKIFLAIAMFTACVGASAQVADANTEVRDYPGPSCKSCSSIPFSYSVPPTPPAFIRYSGMGMEASCFDRTYKLCIKLVTEAAMDEAEKMQAAIDERKKIEDEMKNKK
jgi:hypothetical protein